MLRRKVNEQAVEACRQYIMTSTDYTFENFLKKNNMWNNVDQSGRNPKLSCPFHSDSTPSLYIDDELKVFKCFSCDRGGGYLKFVVLYNQLVLKSSVSYYSLLNNLLAEDYKMRVRTDLVTIYALEKTTAEDILNHKRRRFVPRNEFIIDNYIELYNQMKKEKLTDIGTVKLAILYVQDGYDAHSVYKLIKDEKPVTQATMFEGMNIMDLMEDVQFDLEVG